jgi:hypothetical protein
VPRFAAADCLNPPCEAVSRRPHAILDAAAATKRPDGQISKKLSSPWLKNIPLNPTRLGKKLGIFEN